MQVDELQRNVTARRNKIFLLMEEVRRLRIQQRAKGDLRGVEDTLDDDEAYPSFIPFLPPVTEKTWQNYVNFYAVSVASIILFGGIIAPSLELKMGMGGTSYYDFIASVHLPTQMAQVDPIVASFCGGAVGVLSLMLVVEKNNLAMQARRRCFYCEGTGYLTCGNCLGTGAALDGAAAAAAAGGGGEAAGAGCTCSFCSGTGKVMCTACRCTGKQLATEHDPRVDPFTLTD
jgi:hypothetical protein